MTRQELLKCERDDLLIFTSGEVRAFVMFRAESVEGLFWIKPPQDLRDKISTTIKCTGACLPRRVISTRLRVAPRELSLPTNLDKLEAKLLGVI